MTATEDPQIPPRTENPYSATWEHPTIKKTFDQIQTEQANDAAAKYVQAKEKWETGLETFRRRMNTVIAESWEGQSAEASKSAIARYTSSGSSLTDALGAMATQITAAADAATRTKNAMPAPYETVGFTLDHMPWNSKVREGQRREAEDEAREKMELNYVKPFASVDGSLPALASPVSATKPVDIATPVLPEENPDSSSVRDPNTSGDNSAKPEQGNEPESLQEPTSGEPTRDDSGDASDSPTQNLLSDTDSTPASTNPAATVPAGTVPAATVPTSPTMGSPTSAAPHVGAPANPAIAGGPGAPGTAPVPGRTVQGVPLPAVGNPAGLAATTASGAGGRSGMPGMMAPGIGGARGKDDQAGEHKRADYLVNRHNTAELLGTATNPPVSPAVFGGDALAARTRAPEDSTPARAQPNTEDTRPAAIRQDLEQSRPADRRLSTIPSSSAGGPSPAASQRIPEDRRPAGPDKAPPPAEESRLAQMRRSVDGPRPVGPLRRRSMGTPNGE
ncbi:WXG100 family type VII secretion target [Nocardia sp. NPDC058640]|uniref:WXG100 family type VII secretion target n=1 Tax=Nocardia sp. NPDC058640 TaxID=3346571 RepID=UPI003652DD7C